MSIVGIMTMMKVIAMRMMRKIVTVLILICFKLHLVQWGPSAQKMLKGSSLASEMLPRGGVATLPLALALAQAGPAACS